MGLRVAWVSPFTPLTGVGTFSKAVTDAFPSACEGEEVDLTLLRPRHERLYPTRHRAIPIDGDGYRLLGLFDLVVYNLGNNAEHHGAIIELMRAQPGLVICHDHVYGHVLAARAARAGGFAGYAALLARYGGDAAGAVLRSSRIASRTGGVRYAPWDSEDCVRQPLGRPLADLGAALVVHSAYAQAQLRGFEGPVLRLGMPHDLKPASAPDLLERWHRRVVDAHDLHLVSFGCIQPAKCIDRVVSAIAGSDELRRRLRYTVAGYAGDGAHLRALRDLVARLGLGDVVAFEPDVSEARLARLAVEADLYVNLRDPNTEGSSASLVEQMTSGKPVLVLDSGCYAEIPTGAAIILPADATGAAIADALRGLLAEPGYLPAVGRAGQQHARRWSSTSYADELLRFARHHRALLASRAGVVASRAPPPDGHGAWRANLALARTSLRYLDDGTLATDPALILSLDEEALCVHLAETVLGLFDAPGLHDALRRYVAPRSGIARCLACAKLGLLADAVFADDAAARQRLLALAPVHDLSFWRVVEALPPRAVVVAACLLLAGRLPEADDLAGLDDDSPKRLRMAAILRDAPGGGDAAAEPLRRWLDRPSLPDLPLPVLDQATDWAVGEASFTEGTGLIGFHAVEPDHVWARGTAAFLGVRLGASVARVELLVRHVDARAEEPCALALAVGDAEAQLVATTPEPVWLGLDLPADVARPLAVTWCRVTAARARRPPGSADRRVLGIALIRLRVTLRTAPALFPAGRAAAGSVAA